MHGVPGSVSVDAQPPMAVPLRHFLLGLVFLIVGGLTAGIHAIGFGTPLFPLSYTHLLLVGWICVTIMGAMTQFVPVWSGVTLHSERLATLQAVAVAIGVSGLAIGFAIGHVTLVAPFAVVLFGGFVIFIYNVARTLAAARPFDVTERHFALALAFFFAATLLGATLALDYRYGFAASTRTAIVTAHVTLAVFGGVLTTVIGALFQLGPMFTQYTETDVDRTIQRIETVVYPIGVAGLAGGRLTAAAAIATAGGLLVALGLVLTGIFLGRCLYGSTVEGTPMLSRYWVVAASMILWPLTAAVAWIDAPLTRTFVLGDPRSGTVLLVGIIGFVVLGTLYHIVPFIIWVHRYSDRLGLEDVPMIDDLYDSRIAAIDFWCVLCGFGLLTIGIATAVPTVAVGAAVAIGGAGLFAYNMIHTVWTHSPNSIGSVPIAPFGKHE